MQLNFKHKNLKQENFKVSPDFFPFSSKLSLTTSHFLKCNKIIIIDIYLSGATLTLLDKQFDGVKLGRRCKPHITHMQWFDTTNNI